MYAKDHPYKRLNCVIVPHTAVLFQRPNTEIQLLYNPGLWNINNFATENCFENYCAFHITYDTFPLA